MKLLITGGHFSPAYALIQQLKKQNEIVMVGRRYAFEGDRTESLEYEVCRREGISFIPITTGRLQRKLTRYTILSLLKIPVGQKTAFSILRKERPDIVVSFGGYIALPVAFAAKSLGIPVVLHEQTLHVGFANKIIARVADVICISYDESKRYFSSKKVILTGLPMRKEVFEVKEEITIPHDKKILYITGGSTGAHVINSFIKMNIEELLDKFNVIHQTGDSQKYGDYDEMVAIRSRFSQEKKERFIVKKYITPEEIGSVYSQASVVISRSGANTVAELLALNKKAILIPLPGGQSGEQKVNAEFFVKNGNGIQLLQENLTKDSFFEALEKVQTLAVKKNTFVMNATEKLAQVIIELYEKKKHTKKD
jgi:UDP-N-acetylglucosamine--N-acetylmuramyl-(pentapeptide) pyrophosphoryl-undecaprenol N-acetylglucosamine transferase